MTFTRRSGLALLSALKGWGCVWIALLLSFALRGPRSHIRLSDLLSILAIWLFCTGAVTFVATLLLIVPYLCALSPQALRLHPWRLFVEPPLLTLLGTLCLTPLVKPEAEAFRTWFAALSLFALPTCLASAAFYLRSARSLE